MVRFGIALALGALFIWNPLPFKLLELKTWDYLVMSRDPVQNENILIVDLDEEIVEAYGGYPLPRTLYADLVARSNVAGISVLMPDPDIRDFRNDYVLATNMMQTPTVIASAASTQSEELSLHVGTAQLGEDPTPWLYQFPGILRTESNLAANAAGLGLVTASPEIDGVTRRMPLVVNVQSKLYPSFALELLRVAVGDPSYQLKTTQEGISWVRVPNYPNMITDANGRIFLDWNTKFYRQSAAEFLMNPIEAPFVIFGVTAEGVNNPVPTPAGPKYPHEIQANTLHNLIEGKALSTPTFIRNLVLPLGVFGGLLILFFTVGSIYLSVPILISLIAGSIYGMFYALESSYLLSTSGLILIWFLFWAIESFRSFFTTYLQKQQIKRQFGTYVSPELVKKLQEDPSLLQLGGVTKQLTFLFSDIRGFTPISEKYQKNPQGLTTLINRFLDNQTKIIMKHGGTIDKYMGDCIMAFWGAPLDDDNQIENATKAVIEMKQSLKELNEQLEQEGLDQINTGGGINTGTCVVGNFGSSSRFDYSVLGDAVNLAARLESLCKEYDVGVIISEYSLVDGYDYEYLDEVIVKGKTEPIKIYTIRK